MTLERYLKAAERENTQRSYASALRHFEAQYKATMALAEEKLKGNADA